MTNELFETHRFLFEHCSPDEYQGTSLNEGVTEHKASQKLTEMLELTLAKYSKLDFTEIERSRGDAANFKYYKNLRESIDILCDINAETNNIPSALVVSNALNNLESLKTPLTNAFRTKNNLAIIFYNTIYYSIMECTSYLISASVYYVNNTGDKVERRACAIDSKNTLLVNNLEKFNEYVNNGKVMKFINGTNDLEKSDKSLQEAGIGETISGALSSMGSLTEKLGSVAGVGAIIVGAVAVIYVLVNIIPLIKSCIYMIFKARHKISESAQMQYNFITTNIEILKSNGGDQKVIEKQERSAKFFKAIADKFAIECDNAQNEVNREEKAEKNNSNNNSGSEDVIL